MQRVCTVHRYTMSKQSGHRVRPSRPATREAARQLVAEGQGFTPVAYTRALFGLTQAPFVGYTV